MAVSNKYSKNNMEKLPIAVKKTQSNDVVEFKNRKKKTDAQFLDNKTVIN
jgi:hypothetical protein